MFNLPLPDANSFMCDPLANLDQAIRMALAAERFFAAEGVHRVEFIEREVVAWELFAGYLLDERQTRNRAAFATWQLWLGDEDYPVLSLRYAQEEGRLYLTRQFLVHAFETYEDPPSVIQTRQVERPIAELVGSVPVSATVAFAPRENLSQPHHSAGGPTDQNRSDSEPQSLVDAVSRLVWLALVGSSRLAITSSESPLPSYSLGRIGYTTKSPFCPTAQPAPARRSMPIDPPVTPPIEPQDQQPVHDPLRWAERAADPALSHVERAKVFETALRAVATEDCDALAELTWDLACQQPVRDAGERGQISPSRLVVELVSTWFHHVALSPYTSMVDRLLSVLRRWAARDQLGGAAVLDLVAKQLSLLVRHMNAFDLVLFHNRGANYPDALLLDGLLRLYLELAASDRNACLPVAGDTPSQTRGKRLRRRALRGAWLLRRQYEGHRVPDAPTSPGENLRVLPPETHPHVPDEQINEWGARQRTLFDDATDALLGSLGDEILAAAMEDLAESAELRELGSALFLDRPLGLAKPVGAVDRTPLASYVAASRSMIAHQVGEVFRGGRCTAQQHAEISSRSADLPLVGQVAANYTAPTRPGVVGLEDARLRADDFVFLFTTKTSLAGLLACYDLTPLAATDARAHDWLFSAQRVLMLRTPRDAHGADNGTAELVAYDGAQPRLEWRLTDAPTPQYFEWAGREFVTGGLRVRPARTDLWIELPPRLVL